MALAKCLECGKEVSRSAVACPHCGKPEPTKSEFAKKKYKEKKNDEIFGALWGAIILGIIALKACDII